jgi:site-specific DNA recombinase
MKTAFYIRVSTTAQTQSQTIEQQLERLQHHAQQQGWQITEAAIFRDDGYSGASLKRPGLDRLRDQVAMAQIERIVITAPDRLARNFVHQTLLLEEFQQHGVIVEFLEHPMSQDPHDQLLLQIRGAVAEYERTLIAERMRRGRLQKIQAGTLLPWIVTPYGYRCDLEHPRDATRVSINDAEAAIVSEIFNRYRQREGTLDHVSKYLHELGIASPRGNSVWTHASLRGILTNPVYTGQVYANKTRFSPAKQRRSPLKPIGHQGSSQMKDRSEWILVGQIPAIISSDLFEAVQVKLQQNQQTAKRNNKTHSYLLRALVSCGCCQKTCICVARQSYRYYLCHSKTIQKRFSENERCRARYIPADQIEELVWNDLCNILQHPEMINQAMERLQDGHWLPQELQARRATLQKGQKSLQQQLERLTQAYLGSVIQLEEYSRRRTELEAQLQSLEIQERQLAAQAQQRIAVTQLEEGATEFCQRVNQGLDQATFEQKRQLIELLIDRVVVTNDEVEIRYVIPTNPRGENSRFCHLRLDYFD